MNSRSGEQNAVQACCSACCLCCLRCIEDALQYLNKVAFAYMAVSGDSYCKSAWNGFIINLKHLLQFYYANTLARLFVFMATLFIITLNSGLMYLFLRYHHIMDDPFWQVPVGINVIVTFFLCIVFLGLFDDATMATLMCLAIDKDLHDGTPKYGPPTFHKKLDAIFGDDKIIYPSDAGVNPNEVV